MKTFDLIILGGGISGLGIARAAAQRNLSTALLEAHSCGSATSNNTLRIIHGGFRYLQTGDLPRVVTSLLDQKALLREAPDALAALPCVMPLARFGLKSRLPVSCAALLYATLMRLCGSPLKTPSILSVADINGSIPLLRGLAPHGALCWHDAVMTEPQKVTELLVRGLLVRGLPVRGSLSEHVTIYENTAVQSVVKNGDHFEVRDTKGGLWCSRFVVNALGPWLPHVSVPAELQGIRPRWSRGFNITIARQLDPTYGIGVQSADGRLFFTLPRGSGSSIGTYYLPDSNKGLPPTVSEAELENFISAFNSALPGANVRLAEVSGVDVGLLPMLNDTPAGPKLYANGRIHKAGGYIEVLSTKYTTFRSQGRAVVRAIS